MSEIITLVSKTNPQTTCQIDPIGCGLGEVWLGGHQVLWTGARPDGGRGFTHPCIPNFNLAENLPNHGPARKELWTKVDEHTWNWEMNEIKDVYPAGLKVTRQFVLGDRELTVTTTIKNTSAESLPINIAEHHYFLCAPEKRSEVKVNDQPFSESGLNGEAEYNPWSKNEHFINIPDVGIIKMSLTGYNAFAQWSQPNANFVCVEPIQVLPPQPEDFASMAPKIKPEETKVFSYRLTLES